MAAVGGARCLRAAAGPVVAGLKSIAKMRAARVRSLVGLSAGAGAASAGAAAVVGSSASAAAALGAAALLEENSAATMATISSDDRGVLERERSAGVPLPEAASAAVAVRAAAFLG